MATSLTPEAPAGSLRLRLVGFAGLGILLALAIAALMLVTIFERHLERRVAQELSHRLHELAAVFALDEQGEPMLARPLADPRYEQPLSGAYWQVSGAGGPLLRARALWDSALPPTLPRGQVNGPRDIVWNGATLTVLARDVQLGGGSYRLIVALDHAELTELKTSFTTDVLIALGTIAVALVAGAWLQLRVGLLPLAALQAAVARIRAGRATRLEGRFPSEVAPLAASLNALVDQHENGIRRARERAGDLAHGLKTPLAILAAEANRLEAAGNAISARRLRDQIAAMRAHVERQLARARSHGAMAAGGAVTDVSDTVARLFGVMRRMPRAEAIDWRLAMPDGVKLRVDPEDFGEIAGNLLDNARLWARSQVTASAEAVGGGVRIAIADDGPGIPADDRARVLSRGETTRPPGEGTGIGLSIVKDVLALYGAELALEEATDGGCLASFTLPGWIETPEP